VSDDEKFVREPTEEEVAEAAEWCRDHPVEHWAAGSYNDAVAAAGGKPVGNMTHEEATPVVLQMMRKHLHIPDDVASFEFTEADFIKAVQVMPMEEYVLKRKAIAAFRMMP